MYILYNQWHAVHVPNKYDITSSFLCILKTFFAMKYGNILYSKWLLRLETSINSIKWYNVVFLCTLKLSSPWKTVKFFILNDCWNYRNICKFVSSRKNLMTLPSLESSAKYLLYGTNNSEYNDHQDCSIFITLHSTRHMIMFNKQTFENILFISYYEIRILRKDYFTGLRQFPEWTKYTTLQVFST